MSPSLALQEAVYAWAAHVNNPNTWSDLDVDPRHAGWPGPMREGLPDTLTLAGPDLFSALPPSIGEESTDAYDRGKATVWTALALLLGPVEWTTRAARLCWSPSSPRPDALARLVGAYGVESAILGDDPAALARLAASIHTWQHLKGTLRFAQNVATAAGRGDDLSQITSYESVKIEPERFVCHTAAWWALRPESRSLTLRISGGQVVTTRAEPGAQRPEDIAVRAHPPSPAHCRLLPVWAVARVVDSGAEDER